MNAPSRPQPAAPDHFPVIDDCLQVGGRPLTAIAEQVGRTPFYVYDRELLSARVRSLRAHLPPEVHLHYAIKANPMPALVQHMVTLVDGLDVASAGELRVAMDTGVAPARVSFAGPGKTEQELARACACGIITNIESAREMEILAELARRHGVRPQVAMRVNPDFELKIAGMKMSGGPKPFGVDAEQVPELLRRLRTLPLEFVGFHIFSGSQNLRPAAIIEAQQKTLELACALAADAPAPIRWLNIGGGFGIPYFPGDTALDLVPLGENLRQLLKITNERLPQATLIIELGRYLVGEAGMYVCRVIDRKISRGQVFLITDGGLHHHLAASGNFGQVLRKNYPVVVGNKVVGKDREVVSVVGPLCTPLDILADKMELAHCEPGDLIAVLQSGAYGYTASPIAFLSHPAPAELLL